MKNGDVFNENLVGYWWLPSNPDRKIAGILIHAEDKPTILELQGRFDGENYDVIFGYCNQKEFSLYQSFVTTVYGDTWSNRDFIENTPCSIVVNYFIVGASSEKIDGNKNAKIKLSTTSINKWVDKSGFSYEEPYTGNYNISYKKPESVLLFSDSGVKISIQDRIKLPNLNSGNQEINIYEEKYLLIEISELSFYSLIFYIDALLKFFSLAMRTPISVKSINLITDANDVIVFYRRQNLKIDFQGRSDGFVDFFFGLKEVKNVHDSLSCWFEFLRNNHEVADLYFYSTGRFPKDVFLSKASALEEFHRRNIYKENRSLKERIKSLFEMFHDVMNFTGNSEAFAELVRDHRDYYVHFFKKKRDLIISPSLFNELTKDANLLLEMCLLSKMNFSTGEIVKMVKSNFYYAGHLRTIEERKPIPLEYQRVKWGRHKEKLASTEENSHVVSKISESW